MNDPVADGFCRLTFLFQEEAPLSVGVEVQQSEPKFLAPLAHVSDRAGVDSYDVTLTRRWRVCHLWDGLHLSLASAQWIQSLKLWVRVHPSFVAVARVVECPAWDRIE